jgi:hypothetical protein
VAILKYDDVKEKPSTLRAMTSLEREEFEELSVAFGEAWERHRKAVGYVASQGGPGLFNALRFRHRRVTCQG